jgi:predicted PurR-regulated permease PerM
MGSVRISAEGRDVTEPEINEERITIVLVLSLVVWLAALIAAFWLIGAFAGIIVIIIGAGLLALALARVIRSG